MGKKNVTGGGLWKRYNNVLRDRSKRATYFSLRRFRIDVQQQQLAINTLYTFIKLLCVVALVPWLATKPKTIWMAEMVFWDGGG